MNRPIKFRLWSKNDKKITRAFVFNLSMSGQLYAGGLNVTEHYVIMQWTGLRDINGVKIFEGDIVEYIDNTEGGVYKGVVEFENGMFTFDGGNAMGDYDVPIKVIGNIYQNPELLKDKS